MNTSPMNTKGKTRSAPIHRPLAAPSHEGRAPGPENGRARGLVAGFAARTLLTAALAGTALSATAAPAAAGETRAAWLVNLRAGLDDKKPVTAQALPAASLPAPAATPPEPQDEREAAASLWRLGNWRLGMGGGTISDGGMTLLRAWQVGPVAEIGPRFNLSAGPSFGFGGFPMTSGSFTGLAALRENGPLLPIAGETSVGVAARGALHLAEGVTFNAVLGWHIRSSDDADSTRTRPNESLYFGTVGLGMRF